MNTYLARLICAPALILGACLNSAFAQSPPILNLSLGDEDSREKLGGSTREIHIFRNGDPLPVVSVDLQFIPGGGPSGSRAATPGQDYEAQNQRVEFASGQNWRTVAVRILDDGEADGLEYFTARLVNPSSGVLLKECKVGKDAPDCQELPIVIHDNEIPAALDVARLGQREPLIHLIIDPNHFGDASIVRRPLRSGKKLLTGPFVAVNGVARTGFARLHPDHELDETFTASPDLAAMFTEEYISRPLSDVRELWDGSLLVVDYLGRLYRLREDGSTHPSFSPPFTNGFTHCVEAEDGTLWATTTNRVLRLGSDGALLSSSTIPGAGREIVGILPNGRAFTTQWDDVRKANRLERWLPEGSLDLSFRPIEPWRGFVLPDGRLMLSRDITPNWDLNREYFLLASDGSRAGGFLSLRVETLCDVPRLGPPTLEFDDGKMWVANGRCAGVGWLNGIPVDHLGRYPVRLGGHQTPSLQLSAQDLLCCGRAYPRFEMSERSLAREQKDFVVAFTRLGSTTAPATVHYTTRDVTATEDKDYVAQSGTITFAPLETEKTIQIPILADSEDEFDESLEVVVASAEGFEELPAPMRLTIPGKGPAPRLDRAKRLRDGRVLLGTSTDSPSAIEFSADLKTWHPLTNAVRGCGLDNTAVILDASATNAATRYYRAVARLSTR